jgi:TPR repeat protein
MGMDWGGEMNKRIIFTCVLFSVLTGCETTQRMMPTNRHLYQVNDSISRGAYQQAAIRLERCAANDNPVCVQRLAALKATGMSVENALRDEARIAKERKELEAQKLAFAQRIAKARTSNNPWDKYILFSELSAGTVEAIDADEPSRVAKEAFAGFGDCAKTTDPSCMGMYGELILRGTDTLDPKSKVEARRKAIYWLALAARYGYEPARKALVSQGEDIPSPDLAMEQLQKEANVIAKDSARNQERLRMEQAARDYEMIREARRQTEQMIWSNLFPKMVSCSSNTLGSNTYTRCW